MMRLLWCFLIPLWSDSSWWWSLLQYWSFFLWQGMSSCQPGQAAWSWALACICYCCSVAGNKSASADLGYPNIGSVWYRYCKRGALSNLQQQSGLGYLIDWGISVSSVFQLCVQLDSKLTAVKCGDLWWLVRQMLHQGSISLVSHREHKCGELWCCSH